MANREIGLGIFDSVCVRVYIYTLCEKLLLLYFVIAHESSRCAYRSFYTRYKRKLVAANSLKKDDNDLKLVQFPFVLLFYFFLGKWEIYGNRVQRNEY